MSANYALGLLLLASLGLATPALAEDKGADEAAEKADAKLAAEITALEEELESSPDNVDLRLKLAFRLSWQGNGERARVESEKVIAAAPSYWDAHILRARVTSWAKSYKEAREFLEPVLEAEPKNVDALKLLVTISMWSRDWNRAESTLRTLIAIKPSAEYHFQLAQIAMEQLDPLRARREAGKALELDPGHESAKTLRRQTNIIKFYATSQMEFFPSLLGENRRAYSQAVVASVLPGASLGIALRYDFSRRFSTDNHRFGARVNFRADEDTVISTALRGGETKVLPRWSGDVGVMHRLTRDFSIGARYNLDLMTWPGTLHRGTATVSSQISENVLLGAQYFGGVMRHCGETDFVQRAALKSRFSRGLLAAELRYAFGTELERPALSPLLEDRLGPDFCLDDLGPGVSGSPIDLAETRAHELGASASVTLTSSTLLVAGYGIQLRFDNSEVHLTHLSLQQSF
ncbi:MAG: tetratricopeptide repeat protein [Myxococcales bacterium]|nr:tetratricopeptide repeat protein [Myxococcales bacterium]